MLVRDDLVIPQPAHAWVSGQLARAWGNAEFPAPVPAEAVCLAAEQHDVGWADADLAPLLDPATGRPVPFTAVPRPYHLAIWGPAPRRLLAQSRYAALLVSLHGSGLYERGGGDHPPAVAAAIAAYLDEQRALQAALSAGLDPAEVARNRALLRCWDSFSLGLCYPRLRGGSRACRPPPARPPSCSRPRTGRSPSTRGRSPRTASWSAATPAGWRARSPARRRSTRRWPPRPGCRCAG
ncbi:MAG TPA: DUF3891 family protein, partial [Solirubrobacteraceae bacterium]|nr:DUF3891 family protein [Solirubrobacteraceae bacterium]